MKSICSSFFLWNVHWCTLQTDGINVTSSNCLYVLRMIITCAQKNEHQMWDVCVLVSERVSCSRKSFNQSKAKSKLSQLSKQAAAVGRHKWSQVPSHSLVLSQKVSSVSSSVPLVVVSDTPDLFLVVVCMLCEILVHHDCTRDIFQRNEKVTFPYFDRVIIAWDSARSSQLCWYPLLVIMLYTNNQSLAAPLICRYTTTPYSYR